MAIFTNFVPKLLVKCPIALRVQINSTPYSQSLSEYEGGVQAGELKASPCSSDGVKGVTGVRFTGKDFGNYTGSVVLFPVRDKTLKFGLKYQQNVNDLNNIVKNLTFSRSLGIFNFSFAKSQWYTGVINFNTKEGNIWVR